MNDLDDDFQPEPRGRCYTWPMQHFYPPPDQLAPPPHHHLTHQHLGHHHHQPPPPPNLNPYQQHHQQHHYSHHMSHMMSTLTSSGSSVASSIGGNGGGGGANSPTTPSSSCGAPPGSSPQQANGQSETTSAAQQQTVGQMLAASVPSCSSSMTLGMSLSLSQGGGPMPAKKKRCRKKPTDQLAQKKPNPWGEESYSDIIAKALESAPDGRLKLNEIYQWFSDNIPYFHERSSQEEAAGWKNSIRHNLSLHSRFMRIQNEGAGKSSWWVINPEAKPGRNPRRTRERSNTIESTNKAQLEKTRRGAKKRIEKRVLMGHSGGLNGSSTAGSLQSIQHDLYDDDSMQGSFDTMTAFRSRTQSNLSPRVSPAVGDLYDEMDFPSWVADTANVPNIPSDIVDRTDQMRIDATSHLNGNQIKQETKPIKTEPIAPPQVYHELGSVRGPCSQNPLLSNPIVPSTNFKPMPLPGAYTYQNGWMTSAGLQTGLPGLSCGIAASSSSALPVDLENLTLPDQPLMDMDVETLIRHELSQAAGHQINFDL